MDKNTIAITMENTGVKTLKKDDVKNKNKATLISSCNK